MLSARVRTVIVLAITAVWVLNFVATVALPGYKAPPEINSIFMAMVGTVLVTVPMIGGRRSGNQEQSGTTEVEQGQQQRQQRPDDSERQR